MQDEKNGNDKIKVTYQVTRLLRNNFLEAARVNGEKASAVIRSLMKGYADGKIKPVHELRFDVKGRNDE